MTRNHTLASLITSAALAASLGLSACGNAVPKAGDTTKTQETSAVETSQPKAVEETPAAEQVPAATPVETGAAQFSSDDACWLGMTAYGMVYFVEDSASGQAAFMVYFTEDNTFVRYVGAEQRDGEAVTITDNLTGNQVALTLSGPDADGILTITFEGYDPATLSVTPNVDDVLGTFDQIGTYATERP